MIGRVASIDPVRSLRAAIASDAAGRAARVACAKRLTTRHPLSVERTFAAPLSAPARHGDARRPADTHEPCPRCGTRGDLGCRHQSPFAAR